MTDDGQLTVRLGRDHGDGGALGGKGAALARLVDHDVVVPPTGVVTIECYRRVANDPEVRALIARVRNATGEPVPADAVDEVFARAPIAPDVADAIVTLARELGGPLAVRSSATAEDMTTMSFAGQYRSSLDVEGDDAVIAAVRRTWASLWHPAPVAYRQVWEVADDELAMAVVLMRMVPAVMAGVTFTIDPTGDPRACRVETVEGLGEALVSGETTPRVWLLPRHGSEGDGVPGPVRTAAAIALDVERWDGRPQDVEWAWDGEQVWTVQARPITTPGGDGFDTPIDDHRLTSEGIAEMLPGVIPPLLWDANSFLLDEAFRHVFAAIDALPDAALDGTALVRRVRGRAALDLDLVHASAALLPRADHAELERQLLGEAASGPQTTDSATSGRHRRHRRPRVAHDLRAARHRRAAITDADVVVAAVAHLEADAPDLGSWSEGRLLAYRLRLFDLGARAVAAELGIAAAAVASYERLEGTLARWLDATEAHTQAQRLTVHAGDGVAGASGSASRAIFGGPTWAELETASDSADPPALAVGLDGRVDADEARHELEHRLTARPKWRRTRWLTLQVVDVRIHLLRRLAQDAAEGLRRREAVKRAVLLVGGEVRRVHLELGRRLASRGAIRTVGDVDLLSDRELRRAVTGDAPRNAVLEARRRAMARADEAGILPSQFRGIPVPEAGADELPLASLRGLAASPGANTAVARVLASAREIDHLAPGEIVVAVTTDAGWSPVFARAGGIVVERGGPLSHAAIVARELGIPAVTGVVGATRRLDGQRITVDGDQGTIVVHDDQR